MRSTCKCIGSEDKGKCRLDCLARNMDTLKDCMPTVGKTICRLRLKECKPLMRATCGCINVALRKEIYASTGALPLTWIN